MTHALKTKKACLRKSREFEEEEKTQTLKITTNSIKRL